MSSVSHLSDADLANYRDSLTRELAHIKAEVKTREKAAYDLKLALNPWKVGDRVTTAMSSWNYPVQRITAAAVIVYAHGCEERIPLARVRPADPEKDTREYRWRGYR